MGSKWTFSRKRWFETAIVGFTVIGRYCVDQIIVGAGPFLRLSFSCPVSTRAVSP